MPNSTIKAFAQKSGKSQAEVEKIWKETEAETEKGGTFTKNDPRFWASVNTTVQHKLGIKEGTEKTSFKSFLNEMSYDLMSIYTKKNQKFILWQTGQYEYELTGPQSYDTGKFKAVQKFAANPLDDVKSELEDLGYTEVVI